MFRRGRSASMGVAVAFALLAGAGCGNDDNMITNPVPQAPTQTPVPGAPTATPQPGSPTATPTPVPSGSRIVNVGQGGGMTFTDQVSGSSTTTIPVGTTVQWVWITSFHSTTSGTCSGACTPDGLWDSGAASGITFTRTFNQAGTFPYYCSVHGSMMTGTVVVQ